VTILTAISSVLQMLRAQQFDDAVPAVSDALRQAAAESPGRLTEVAGEIVRWPGIFPNTDQAKRSEPFFRTVYSLLSELSGPESPLAMTAAQNLAGLLGSIDKIDEAISLRERLLDHVTHRFPSDDQRVMMARDSLAILYRRAGLEEMADHLYDETGLCEHLRSAEQYVRASGARVVACCRPWTTNCHIWVYVDSLLDCERLIANLRLDSCIQLHDHRGTHDGSERGIVCTLHNDAIMGPHPADAPPGVKTISA